MTSTLQGISYDSNFASESVSEYNSRRESMMCELVFSRFMVANLSVKFLLLFDI